jgi:hypothetical protein
VPTVPDLMKRIDGIDPIEGIEPIDVAAGSADGRRP